MPTQHGRCISPLWSATKDVALKTTGRENGRVQGQLGLVSGENVMEPFWNNMLTTCFWRNFLDLITYICTSSRLPIHTLEQLQVQDMQLLQ